MYFNRNLTIREITVKLRPSFRISEKTLQNFIRNNFKNKTRTKDYTEDEIRFLLYMYKNCNDINLLCDYLNKNNRIHLKGSVEQNGC